MADELDRLSGSVIIAQTPFDDRGSVDLDSIDTLTEFYLGHGADGFVVLGVSGEGPRLAPDEALEVASRFISRPNGKPIIVGVSNTTSAQLRMLVAEAMERGASGVMIAHRQLRGAFRAPLFDGSYGVSGVSGE
jgi:4-hydroxy-tetrahydrodipicolinate synthase